MEFVQTPGRRGSGQNTMSIELSSGVTDGMQVNLALCLKDGLPNRRIVYLIGTSRHRTMHG